MNISTDLDQVSPDHSKPPSGYEWWYFDGLSTDGKYGFVIIFYHDNPFSTRKIKKLDEDPQNGKPHPAISISIYRNNKTVYYSFLEFGDDDFSWDGQNLRLSVHKNTFHYDIQDNTLSFEMDLDQKLTSGHSILGTIKGRGGLSPASLINSKSPDRHHWNLILPVFDFQLDLKIDGLHGEQELVTEGKGYHDHNTGHEPMKESFREWYWGRCHFKDLTLIYYLMEKHGSRQFEAWLIDGKNDSVLEYFTSADLDYKTPNWFGLKSARKIELKSGQVFVNIQLRDKIDDGPFYQRFIADSILRYNDQVYAAQGISEYIYPENISKRVYWPLVHMRLRYMNERPHWVQKSRLMYPWTW